MQIKVEKEPYSLTKALWVYLILFLLYFAIAVAPGFWLNDDNWQSLPFLRWLNLMLIPLIFSLIITHTSRIAHLHLTHLSEPEVIRQRLLQSLQQQGYSIAREFPDKVYLRSRFFLWDFLMGKGNLQLKEKKSSVQISGCWSKIHQLEKLTHEGEILLPNPK
ncbi:hypothetical protein OKW21_003460 [Catalinimonas alkaloidigena]|uniref:hypothetical protein n=1 Tax=Catalinimonas alkaloidigena TaxID=1075417 RepID=UPI0024058B6B|nr:hypothetical protein [Catalinimonas alkaloidigena]MDF9798197.1 hypothetical protein [Catalinimonas alkaloidigena]